MSIDTVWTMSTGTTREWAIYLVALDGDVERVEVEDRSIDIGRRPISSGYAMTSGRRVTAGRLPTRLRRELGRADEAGAEALHDVESAYLGHVVTDRFKAVVDTACGDGVHQFEPVEVVNALKEEDRHRWWFVPGVRLKPLDPDLTQPLLNRQGFYDIAGTTSETREPVFRRGVVTGHPIFAAAEMRGIICVSDEMRSACEAAGLTGLVFDHSFPVR
jgi:hypothetical protein